jgi:hypothetical protein
MRIPTFRRLFDWIHGPAEEIDPRRRTLLQGTVVAAAAALVVRFTPRIVVQAANSVITAIGPWFFDDTGNAATLGKLFVGRSSPLTNVYSEALLEVDNQWRTGSDMVLLGDDTPGQEALLRMAMPGSHQVFYVSSDNTFLMQNNGTGSPHYNFFTGDAPPAHQFTVRMGLPTGDIQGAVGLRFYEPVLLGGANPSSRGWVGLALFNNSGQTLNSGDLVQVATNAPGAVTLTAGPKARFPGVVTRGNIALGDVWVTFGPGRAAVACDDGAVEVGDIVCSGPTPGKASVDNNETNPLVILGQALTAKPAGSPGLVDVMLLSR